MAISRFDTPAQADFINTYVPIPFKEMMAAGAAKQQRYDQTAASMGAKASAIGQMQAAPGSKDEQTLADMNRDVEDIVSEYSNNNIDLSNSVIRANIDRRLKAAAPREVLNKIAGTYAGYANDMKERAALHRQGNLAPDEMQFDFTGYDSMEEGVYSGLPTRRRDPDEFARNLFSEMKPEHLGYVRGTDKNGIPIGIIEKRAGVTDARLIDHIDKNVSSFAQSADGQYLIDETRAFNPKDERKDEQIAYDYLMAKRGEYTQSTSQMGSDPATRGSSRSSGSGYPEVRGKTMTAPRPGSYKKETPNTIEGRLESNRQQLTIHEAQVKELNADENATKAQKEALQLTGEQLRDAIRQDNDTLDDFEEMFDNKFRPQEEAVQNKILALGKELGIGSTEEEVVSYLERRLLKDPVVYSDALAGAGLSVLAAQPGNLAKMIAAGMTGIPSTAGMGVDLWAALADKKIKRSDIFKKITSKEGQLISESQKLANIYRKKKKAYKEAVTDHASITQSNQVILLPQMSESNGIQYIGPSSDKKLAAFNGQVVPDIIENPDMYDLKGISGIAEDKQLKTYIKENGMSLSATGLVPNEDGSVNVYFKIHKKDKKGKLSEKGVVLARITEERQIEALADDMRKGGDFSTASRLRYDNRKLSAEIDAHEWNSKPHVYEMVSSDFKTMVPFEVTYNFTKDRYEIRNGMGEMFNTAETTEQLKIKLYNLQDAVKGNNFNIEE